MSSSGPASRSVVPTVATSAVPRAVRSPVPARSTTDAGSASVRSTNSSRTRASVRSPNRCPAYRAHRASSNCAVAQATIPSAARSTASTPPPARTWSMIRPSSHGPASPAPAAAAFNASTAAKARASARTRRPEARRTSAGSAIGNCPRVTPGPPRRPGQPVLARAGLLDVRVPGHQHQVAGLLSQQPLMAAGGRDLPVDQIEHGVHTVQNERGSGGDDGRTAPARVPQPGATALRVRVER
ncbi:hypothetical protein SALBM311S_06641 [Streptomyces alboniger]